MDTKDHRLLAQIVRAGPMKSVENIRQRMIERGSPAVSNATVNRELHRMNYTQKTGSFVTIAHRDSQTDALKLVPRTPKFVIGQLDFF